MNPVSYTHLDVYKRQVLVHGHNPVVSEMILAAARDDDLVKEAVAAGAKGINIAGLCCTCLLYTSSPFSMSAYVLRKDCLLYTSIRTRVYQIDAF